MMLLYTHLKLKLGYLRKKLIRICYPTIKVAHLVIREATVMKKKTDKFSNQKLISIQVIKIDKCEKLGKSDRPSYISCMLHGFLANRKVM